MKEGQTQLRTSKDVLEFRTDQRNVELEIMKLQEQQNKLMSSMSKSSGALEKKLALLYDVQKKKLQDQVVLSKKLAAQQDLVNRAIGTEATEIEQSKLQALLNQNNTLENQLNLIQAVIGKKKYEISLAEDLQKTEVDRNLDLLGYLSKYGKIFGTMQKHLQNAKKLNITSMKGLLIYAAIATVVEEIFNAFLEVDKAAAKFRIGMGMLRDDTERVYKEALKIATEFAGVGVNMEGALDATAALAMEFGGTIKVSKDLVETTALLKSQLGVAEESSAGFFRNIAALSKTTAQAQRSMAYVASSLSAAAGVPLNMVMQDVAKMSGDALSLVSRLPEKIVKTAVAARELGTTINKMAEGSRSILNFTENVQAEMEASVLVGQNINLQLARELAYRRDIEGSTREILRIAKKIDFENLDIFQMQAFAAASGRSVDELLKMIQAQRQMNEARNIPGLQEEVAIYDKLKSQRDSGLKDEALQRELTVKQMANQERIAALQQTWNQLIMEAGVALFPAIDGFLKILIVLVKIGPALAAIAKVVYELGVRVVTLGPHVKKLGTFFGGLSHYLLPAITAFKFMSDMVTTLFSKVAGIGTLIARWVPFLGKIGSVIRGIGGLFGGMSKFALPFLKVVPVLGWIILAFQAIGSAIQHIGAAWRGEIKWWEVFVNVVYDILIKPFKGIYDWVMKHLGANSPSEIGLSIVRGIVAVGGMIFDALTYPFRMFLTWVEKIPLLGGIAEKMRGKIEGMSPSKILTESPAGPTKVEAKSTPEEKEQSEASTATLQEILKAVNTLNTNLVSGKVGVYIDGQLLSTTLARQTAFKGGYGTNQVTVAG